MIKEEYKYSELTGKIIGCAMEVHKVLGNGFQEVIYQRALAWELSQAGLSFQREIEHTDFVVEGKKLLELKALIELEDVHLTQTLNYLKAHRIEVVGKANNRTESVINLPA